MKVYKDEAISGTVPLGERPAGRRAALRRWRAASSTRCWSTGSTGSGRTLLVVVDAHDRLEQAGRGPEERDRAHRHVQRRRGRLIFQMLASFSEFEREDHQREHARRQEPRLQGRRAARV